MGVRKQRSTTVSEILEDDINIAIKKAKSRFRDEKTFYILDYNDIYFAKDRADRDRETGLEIYAQKWIFEDERGRWKQVE